MPKSRRIAILIGVFLVTSALSMGAAHADRHVHIKACNDRSVDLRSAAIGFRCPTSKGSLFERVAKDGFGEAWKGPDGLIWSDSSDLRYPQYDAAEACRNWGGTLPSLQDFRRGESNGFREVLPNMEDRWFWSSSVDMDEATDAWGVSGNDAENADAVIRTYVGSFRCVAR